MVDAGATALTLGKLHANRAVRGGGGGIGGGSRRRKAVDAAILWFEQAEACFRGAAPGRDKQVSVMWVGVFVYRWVWFVVTVHTFTHAQPRTRWGSVCL